MSCALASWLVEILGVCYTVRKHTHAYPFADEVARPRKFWGAKGGAGAPTKRVCEDPGPLFVRFPSLGRARPTTLGQQCGTPHSIHVTVLRVSLPFTTRIEVCQVTEALPPEPINEVTKARSHSALRTAL